MLDNGLNSFHMPLTVHNVFTIQRPWVRYNTTISVNDRARSRHRATTPRLDRYILRQHINNRFTRTTQTARRTIDKHQRSISDDTVWGRLISSNIRYVVVRPGDPLLSSSDQGTHSCRRPTRGPILAVRHRQERLKWTMKCQNWLHKQWRSNISADESCYCISNTDGGRRVWRKAWWTLYWCMHHGKRPNIIMWSGIGLNIKLRPVIFCNIGTGRCNEVSAARYIDQVLRTHVVPLFAR